MTEYKKIECKGACNHLKRQNLPYDWDLNIYRGCIHGCKYCYALYSHQYMNTGNDNFFDTIYIKSNIVERLEKQFRSPSWKGEVVNIGSVCDSYQLGEKDYKIMSEVLKVFIKYKNPAIISTKSDLILRDYDLIDELSKLTHVNIAATITTTDEKIRELIEPNGVSSKRRFAMLKEFRKTNASVGMHTMPIVPFLTDSYENFESLFSNARDVDVHYAITGSLYLRGTTKPYFLNFIKETFPHLYDKYIALYKTGSSGKEYKSNIYKIIHELRTKYRIPSSYISPMVEKMKKDNNIQLSLF